MDIRLSPDEKQIAERRGRLAERLACWWFRFHGYRLVAHRWRSPFGEIDLVMRRRRTLVFVEVKWRRNAIDAAALPPRKQGRIIRAARFFLARHPMLSTHDCRFDVIIFHPAIFFWPICFHHFHNALSDPGIGLDR
jgi:putative endonuclease